MNYLELSEFCSKDGHREALRKPFNFGENEVCATDGHVCVIIKGRGVDPENPIDLQSVIDKMTLDETFTKVDFSKINREQCKCEDEDRPCPCCKGYGTIEADYDFTDYDGKIQCLSTEIKCPVCEDWEENNICRKCRGCGFVYNERTVKIGTQYFDAHSLLRLKGLEDLTIQNGIKLGASKITFNGGWGFLMPIREDMYKKNSEEEK